MEQHFKRAAVHQATVDATIIDILEIRLLVVEMQLVNLFYMEPKQV